MVEQESFETPTEALHDESGTEQYVAGSRADEKKVVVEEKGTTEKGHAKNYDEEGEFRRSGKKLCKIRGDCPEESKVVDEESKTKPVLESESESSRVSSVFNSRDLKAPTETPGGSLLLLKNTEQKKSGQEVAQTMSEPGWRVDDDDPPMAERIWVRIYTT